MVLPLIPTGNATDACAGIAAYNAGRGPVVTATYVVPNMFAAAIVVILTLVGLLGVWRYQNNPRFAKIRPDYYSFVILASFVVYTLAGIVGEPAGFPCIIPLILYPLSISIMMLTIITRAMRVSLEHHYAQLTKARAGVVAADATTDAPEDVLSQTASTSSSLVRTWRDSFYGVLFLLHVALGTKQIQSMEFRQVYNSRRMFEYFSFLMGLPGMLGYLFAIAAVPQVRNECAAECRGVFLETPILFSVLSLIYIYLVAVCTRVAYRNVRWDDKGIIQELVLINVVTGVPMTVVWWLAIIDPNDLAYHRIFNWHFLSLPSIVGYWWVSFGLQFYHAHRLERAALKAARVEDGLASDMKMLAACAADPELKREFREFAAKQYCSELVLFLDDCMTYRSLFFDKSLSWRLSKAKLLVRTYIEPGAELEVNISWDMKKRILSSYLNPTSTNDALFDEAAKQVEDMLQYGPWNQFITQRRKRQGKLAGKLAIIANLA